MVRDFGRYLAALMRHWSGWLTGGVLIAGLTIYERVSGKTVPSSWFIGFAMVSFVLASFLVWREQRDKSRRSEAEATALRDAAAKSAARKQTRERLADFYRAGEQLKALLSERAPRGARCGTRAGPGASHLARGARTTPRQHRGSDAAWHLRRTRLCRLRRTVLRARPAAGRIGVRHQQRSPSMNRRGLDERREFRE